MTRASGACRVCGGGPVKVAGSVAYFQGYEWPVHDCAACGCRFTPHDARAHAELHRTGALAHYAGYGELAGRVQERYRAGDTDGLRRLLAISPKFRFVIDALAREPMSARVLEFGCSRGYLTAYFILQGRSILGVDAAPEAIAAARAAFGDHFALANDTTAARSAPYDVVYHVGLIGCVADPLGLTRHLLSLVRPGGRVIFNAPNREALSWRGQLWFDSAPPPDLVTLFPPGFWETQLGGEADVREWAENLPPAGSVAARLRRTIGPRWRLPIVQTLSGTTGGHAWEQRVPFAWSWFERLVTKAAVVTGAARLAPPVPAEYGTFVEMVAR